MVDDTYMIDFYLRNESFVKLSEEIQEFNDIKDEDNNVKDSKEKMIKE